MSAAKHTPAPWEATPTGPWDGWNGWSVEDASGRVVCDAHGSQSDCRREANARLIAAAPELLAVAEHCRDLLMRYEINRIDGEELSDAALKKLNAAIAKAEVQS